MKLELKAKHFEGTYFYNVENNPISKAYKEATGNDCFENSSVLFDLITEATYKKNPNEKLDFVSDKIIAYSHGFNEAVIRTIELTES